LALPVQQGPPDQQELLALQEQQELLALQEQQELLALQEQQELLALQEQQELLALQEQMELALLDLLGLLALRLLHSDLRKPLQLRIVLLFLLG
jgi:hypothetical protein